MSEFDLIKKHDKITESLIDQIVKEQTEIDRLSSLIAKIKESYPLKNKSKSTYCDLFDSLDINNYKIESPNKFKNQSNENSLLNDIINNLENEKELDIVCYQNKDSCNNSNIRDLTFYSVDKISESSRSIKIKETENINKINNPDNLYYLKLINDKDHLNLPVDIKENVLKELRKYLTQFKLPENLKATLYRVIIKNSSVINNDIFTIIDKNTNESSFVFINDLDKRLKSICVNWSIDDINIMNSAKRVILNFNRYRPDIGYKPGMESLAVIGSLYMNSSDLFTFFTSLILDFDLFLTMFTGLSLDVSIKKHIMRMVFGDEMSKINIRLSQKRALFALLERCICTFFIEILPKAQVL